MCTFGYMVFIIIFKMCKDWGPGSTPPLLIQTMIQMFLSPGSVTQENLLYEGQGAVQAILVLAAVFSVPFMLFPIPCITNFRNKAYLRRLAGDEGQDNSSREIQMHGEMGQRRDIETRQVTHYRGVIRCSLLLLFTSNGPTLLLLFCLYLLRYLLFSFSFPRFSFVFLFVFLP